MRGKIEGDGEVAKGAVTEKMGGGGRGRMGKGKKERKAKEGESRERKTRYKERISGKKGEWLTFHMRQTCYLLNQVTVVD